ncbi:MAG: Lrp/AsnC family transcriptional regulator [Nanoarchaeota archaeon]|nr:Lrp/AsnC family transcriptional regulator [Nanoarchaeota archaeon]
MAMNYINWVVQKSPPLYKIDSKDRKIIQLLSGNSRSSLKSISKEVKISEVAVFRRIRRLEKQGIITGHTCLIDFQKLGFDIYCVGIKVNVAHKEKEGYIQQMLKNPFLSQIVALSGGKWDFLVRFFSKRENIEEVISYFDHPQIERFDLSQISRLFYERKDTAEVMKSSTKREQADKKDISILHELAIDSRQSITDLALKVGLSAKQTMERIKNLLQKKIILALSAYSNPMVYGGMGFLLLIETKMRSPQEKIATKLVRHKTSTGGWVNLQTPNIITGHIISDLKELDDIEDEMADDRESIKTWNFVKIDEQLYYNFFPDKIFELLIQERESQRILRTR